jgi:hypothetical protein
MMAVSWQLRERARLLRERAPEAPADLEALVHQMQEKTPASAPLPTASAATPRSPGAGASKHPGAPASRPARPTPRPKN